MIRWGIPTTDEQRAVLDLVDRLGLRRRPDDAADEISSARKMLAAQGLWTIGVPEHAGGGGADHATTALALAAISATWPAVGLAMAQVHAAGPAAPPGVAQGAPIAVLDLDEGTFTDGVGAPRIDVTSPTADLLVLVGDRVTLVSAADATFGPALRRTGLDGACTVPVEFAAGAARDIDAGLVAEDVRTRWYGAVAAVAAGLAAAASAHAADYAAGRIQFGGPLTDLPTMRAELSARPRSR